HRSSELQRHVVRLPRGRPLQRSLCPDGGWLAVQGACAGTRLSLTSAGNRRADEGAVPARRRRPAEVVGPAATRAVRALPRRTAAAPSDGRRVSGTSVAEVPSTTSVSTGPRRPTLTCPRAGEGC